MKRHAMTFLRLLPVMLFALLTAACNVYEWYEEEPEPTPTPPEPETPAFVLNLNFDTDLPLHQEIPWSRAAADPHDIRYQIFIYSGTADITPSVSPVKRMTITKAEAVGLNHSLEIDLEEGQYSFLVWADYVAPGTTGDKYYTTSNLAEITLSDKNNHPGSNDHRDAFRGQTTGTVDKINGGSATVQMKRPMARFEFITTDLEEFVAKEAARRSAEEGRAGGDKSETESSDSRADLSGYTVRFRYTGFMPSSYNIYGDKPIDAWTGVHFDSSLEAVSDGTRMGYDYVMVNGSETSVSVAVEVYDDKGTRISATNTIEVPLVRSKLTVVKGEFMSASSGGGVAIDPGFDGEFNIEIK